MLPMENAEAKEALDKARKRVQAISLMHELFYDGKPATKVDMSGFVSKLVLGLEAAFGYNEKVASLDIEVIEMDMDMATSVSIIINELVSNALKHALENHPSPKLSVVLKKLKPGKLHLEVTDNGPGLPTGFTIEKTKSLGLKLVESYTNMLHGRLEIRNKNGTSVRLELEYISPPND